MTSFFDKLKKGMTIKNSPSIEKDIEQGLSSALKEIDSLDEIKQQEQPAEEPSIISATAPVSAEVKTIKKAVKSKKGKTKKLKKTEKKTVLAESKFEEEKFEKKKIEIMEENGEFEKEEIEIKEKKWFEPEGQLTVDVYQTNEEIVIQSAIAGIKPGDLDISIENDMITIKGTREKSSEKEVRNYFHQECYWGRFSRKIISPVEIDGSRVKATMKNGVLTIRIPKIEREKKRKIIVEG